jgi:hypothetical protein
MKEEIWVSAQILLTPSGAAILEQGVTNHRDSYHPDHRYRPQRHRPVACWLDADAPYEWTAPDGTYIIRTALLDFDYHMAYLLQVRDGWNASHLFCYQKHAGTATSLSSGCTTTTTCVSAS